MLYFALTLLALFAVLGYARIAAFVINMAVFGNKHERHSLLKWALLGALLTLLGLSVLFVPFIRALIDDDWTQPAVAGGVWLAFAAAAGAAWTVSRAIHHRREAVSGVELTRSDVVKLRKGHIHYPALTKLGLHNDVYDLEINRWEVKVPFLPAPFERFRIAFLSDTHVAPFMRKPLYKLCIDTIREAECDLVLLGGDFITWERHIELMADTLTDGLTAREGIYAVLGNHDYWSDGDGVVAALTSRGVRFIHNRAIPIERDGERIYLAGLDEIYRGFPDVAATFERIPEEAPRIVVSHHPDIVDLLGEERADLLLCGHTHGGQIRFPFFGALLVPSRHEARYDMGFFRRRRLLMYVGRGIGAVPPVRILCRPELPIFDLVRA